ncbi:hypothetical protein [uncultured Kordia sp.]|uniref:hypothetical protein n=1 Tax=uncultured Kordia sp. TaxID=507699 RepID=UPI0026062CD6|nr:hypothetical protein [uncultured Kordia sp.]
MSSKDDYANELLFFGVTCIVCAFYFFAPTLLTSQSSLIEQKGTVIYVKTTYIPVGDSRSKSTKARLAIRLENDPKFYSIFKNIGNDRSYKLYEDIERRLEKSGSASIWIQEGELKDIEPKVFQIATGIGNILYDMDDAKSELRWVFPFLLVCGFVGIGAFGHHKYPGLFNKLKEYWKS